MPPDRILAQSSLPRLKNRKAKKKNLIPSKTSKVFPFREPERESEEGQTRYESVGRDVEKPLETQVVCSLKCIVAG